MRKILSLVLVFLLVAFTGCTGSEGKALRYDIISDPINLDPQMSSSNTSDLILQNTMQGLLKLDETGGIVPAISEEYSLSADGKTYTFKLNKSIEWSDGKKVTANDFVFAFRRLMSPETGSDNARKFFVIQNAKAVNQGLLPSDDLKVSAADEYTLVITLKSKSEDFLSLLTTPSAMPCNQDFFDKTEGKYGLSTQTILANGEFLVKKWIKDDYLSLVKNEKYFEAEKVIPKGVTFVVTQQNEQRFLSDKTDICYFSGSAKIDLKKYNTQEYYNTVWGMTINSNNKIISNKNVKKAIRNCFDIKLIESKLPTNLRIAENGNSVGSSTEKAREYLRAGLQQLGKQNLNGIEIIMPDTLPHDKIFSEIAQAWQEKLGLYVKIKSLPMGEYQDRITAGKFGLAIAEKPRGSAYFLPMYNERNVLVWRKEMLGVAKNYADGIINFSSIRK